MAEKSENLFDVGDMAVYPAHGVGKIESIETRDVGDKKQAFYVIRIVETNMTIMIPTVTSDSVGLRAIIESDQVDEIYTILKERDVTIESQPWNQRYRNYMEKIKTGSVHEIAQVLRDLYILKVDKTLSFGERKMMDTAQNLLVKEISIANHLNEDVVVENISHIFA